MSHRKRWKTLRLKTETNGDGKGTKAYRKTYKSIQCSNPLSAGFLLMPSSDPLPPKEHHHYRLCHPWWCFCHLSVYRQLVILPQRAIDFHLGAFWWGWPWGERCNSAGLQNSWPTFTVTCAFTCYHWHYQSFQQGNPQRRSEENH